MKTTKFFIVALVAVLLIASCTTFKLEGLQVAKNSPKYTTVGTFDITVPVMELLGSAGGANLLNVTADKMNTVIQDAIQREITKASADAAINVTIEYSAGFIDILLNGITGSILAPATAHITGTLVKY